MIYDNLEFHNVAELLSVDDAEGLRLQRVPEGVRAQVDEGTAGVMLSPANSEIRFRFTEDNDSVTVRLSSNGGALAFVYHGPFQGQPIVLDKEPTEVVISTQKRLNLLTPAQRAEFDYNPEMIRICFGNDYPEPVTYYGNSGGVCPPHDGDVPAKTYLSYGSSITHGTDQSGAALSYPAHTAWKLGMDLRNLGASGCCLCEPALADYLAEQTCDLMTLELSVNMLGRGYSADEFRERARYLVERVADSDPQRPVVCITIFPHYNDLGDHMTEPNQTATSEEYRDVFRNIVAELDRPNLTLIEGPELLKDVAGLSTDLIHPGARGMIQIGEELARRLAKYV